MDAGRRGADSSGDSGGGAAVHDRRRPRSGRRLGESRRSPLSAALGRSGRGGVVRRRVEIRWAGRGGREVVWFDDYQGVALALGDWQRLAPAVTVDALDGPIGDIDRLAERLAPYDAILAMRERSFAASCGWPRRSASAIRYCIDSASSRLR